MTGNTEVPGKERLVVRKIWTREDDGFDLGHIKLGC